MNFSGGMRILSESMLPEGEGSTQNFFFCFVITIVRLGGADSCSIILAQILAHFPFWDDKNCVIKIYYLRLAAEVAIEHH